MVSVQMQHLVTADRRLGLLMMNFSDGFSFTLHLCASSSSSSSLWTERNNSLSSSSSDSPWGEQKLLSTSLSPDLQAAPVDGRETITQARRERERGEGSRVGVGGRRSRGSPFCWRRATYHSHLMEQPSVNQEERGGANRYHWPLMPPPLSPEGPALQKDGSGVRSRSWDCLRCPPVPRPRTHQDSLMEFQRRDVLLPLRSPAWRRQDAF